MGSTIAGLAIILGLGAWHLRVRRHRNWRYCPGGRFYMTQGYGAVAIAVYWLTESATRTDWEWVQGNFWAFAAMVSFVYGFNALNDVAMQQQAASTALESMAAPEGTSSRTSAQPGPSA